jgi:hypothetical protein
VKSNNLTEFNGKVFILMTRWFTFPLGQDKLCPHGCQIRRTGNGVKFKVDASSLRAFTSMVDWRASFYVDGN